MLYQGIFPVVRADRLDQSSRKENSIITQDYPARSVYFPNILYGSDRF